MSRIGDLMKTGLSYRVAKAQVDSEAMLPPVQAEPALLDWITKIQLVNRRSEHFNSVIDTFCVEALRGEKAKGAAGQ